MPILKDKEDVHIGRHKRSCCQYCDEYCVSTVMSTTADTVNEGMPDNEPEEPHKIPTTVEMCNTSSLSHKETGCSGINSELMTCLHKLEE